MCGRYGFTANGKKLIHHYELVSDILDLKPRYNIAPSQTNPVITVHDHNKLEMMKWGLIPFWAKDPHIGMKMINARAEGIESKPAFRKPFKSQRCLVPASFFYEWQRVEGEKTPFLIKLKDTDLFSFAGLYDVVKDADGKELKTYIIITTEPNELMAKIHNRMPVILNPENEKAWLDPDRTEPEHLLPLLKPYPSDQMSAYIVSTSVNSPANDYEDLSKPEVRSL